MLYKQGTLLNVLWQPGWEGSLGRKDTGIWMAESLHCSPEAIATLAMHQYTTKSLKVTKQNTKGVTLSLSWTMPSFETLMKTTEVTGGSPGNQFPGPPSTGRYTRKVFYSHANSPWTDNPI